MGESGQPFLGPILLKKYFDKLLSIFNWHLTCSYNHVTIAIQEVEALQEAATR